MSMKLATICRGILDLPENLPAGLTVSGIAVDSRRVKSGDMFVAIPGLVSDGHDYLDEAVRRGAAVLVTMKPVPEFQDKNIVVPETRTLAGPLAARVYGDPASGMKTVGVTGTNGKTTVTYLLESVLKAAGLSPGVIGTLNYRWPGHQEEAVRTTPDAVDLQQLLAAMRRDGADCAVMEVSSHALALSRTNGVPFDAAVFTNISRDHRDFHRTEQEYVNAKRLLFKQIKKDGVAVINRDDPYAESMMEAAKERTVTFGYSPKADCRIENVRMSGAGGSFTLVRREEKILLKTGLPGGFNISNAAASAVTGLEMGLTPEQVSRGIGQAKGVPGRMEQVCTGADFSVIVDYAHTPQALHHVLRAVREFTAGNVLAVFGCGGDRDRGKRPEMGGVAAGLADLVILTNDNPRGEDPEAIISDIMAGIDERARILVIPDRAQAIRRGVEQLKPGDSLLIAGKGHECEQIIGPVKTAFSDVQVARECLREIAGIECS